MRRILEHGAGGRPRAKRAVGLVSPIGEGLVLDATPGRLPPSRAHRACQAHERCLRKRLGGTEHHGVGDLGATHGGVIQRAVRLDVRDDGSKLAGDGREPGDLQGHAAADRIGGEIEFHATKACSILVAGMRADPHAAGTTCLDEASHGVVASGMAAAGDVGGGDDIEEGQIPRDAGGSFVLAHVAVEIDRERSRHVISFPRVSGRKITSAAPTRYSTLVSAMATPSP